MKTLKDFNFRGKRVLVRCDFNVPIENGKVLDDFRIQRSLKTITYLRREGAKVILMSHLSEEDGLIKKSPFSNFRLYQDGQNNLSLKPVAARIEQILVEKILFSKKIIGREVQNKINAMNPGGIILLENLRLNKGEEANDMEFARALSLLGDFYVAESFSVCHRKHASIVSLPKILPHCAGFELLQEVEVLSKILKKPQHPFVVVIGGAKLESKIKVLESFLRIADHLLLGGKIADVILTVKGLCVGRPWPEAEIVKRIEALDLTNLKFHLPVDAVVSSTGSEKVYLRQIAPGSIRKEEEILDVGQETVEHFGRIIKEARTVFWSGPLGLAEEERFSGGTKGVARAIIENKNSFNVVGGGDTVSLLREFNFLDGFSYVSVGGGAMLSFLVNEEMPGLEALAD